nr:glycoside hydrolase [Armatimonadota bacterium]
LLLTTNWATASRADASPFQWGETTHVANAGWGRMIPLKNGRWLCVNNLYPKPNSILQLEISTDKARTWAPLTTVGETGRNLDNGEIIQLADGTLRLTCRSVIDKRDPGANLSYHLPVYQSADGGKMWTFLSQIDTNEQSNFQTGQPSQGLWEPHFYLLADGRLACAYATEKHSIETPAYSQTCALKVSPDGGKTWGPEIPLAVQPGGGNLRPGMPVVTRMADGRFIAVYEIIGQGNGDVYQKTSPDGVSWPPGLGTFVPGQHAGPWITSLSDGRIVVTSCSNFLSYSDDFGANWQPAFPAVDVGQVFTWPAIYQTGPTEIAVMTSYHGINIRWGRYTPRTEPKKETQK